MRPDYFYCSLGFCLSTLDKPINQIKSYIVPRANHYTLRADQILYRRALSQELRHVDNCDSLLDVVRLELKAQLSLNVFGRAQRYC
jgi:hypothetical protein